MHVASFIKRKTCYKVLPAELSNVIDEEGDLHSGRSSLACQGPGTRSSGLSTRRSTTLGVAVLLRSHSWEAGGWDCTAFLGL